MAHRIIHQDIPQLGKLCHAAFHQPEHGFIVSTDHQLLSFRLFIAKIPGNQLADAEFSRHIPADRSWKCLILNRMEGVLSVGKNRFHGDLPRFLRSKAKFCFKRLRTVLLPVDLFILKDTVRLNPPENTLIKKRNVFLVYRNRMLHALAHLSSKYSHHPAALLIAAVNPLLISHIKALFTKEKKVFRVKGNRKAVSSLPLYLYIKAGILGAYLKASLSLQAVFHLQGLPCHNGKEAVPVLSA